LNAFIETGISTQIQGQVKTLEAGLEASQHQVGELTKRIDLLSKMVTVLTGGLEPPDLSNVENAKDLEQELKEIESPGKRKPRHTSS
jgi:hypothetical protein